MIIVLTALSASWAETLETKNNFPNGNNFSISVNNNLTKTPATKNRMFMKKISIYSQMIGEGIIAEFFRPIEETAYYFHKYYK